jgi:ABC-type glycerol-3-phosphate transport system substrate-binding protein
MIDVKRRAFAAVALAGALLMAGCNSGGETGSGADAASPTDPANLSGEITVLTNRTDLVTDGSMDKYAAEFKKVYPKVTVKFQGITDYEGEVKIRMNSDEYGDVLLIPQVVAKADYPKFFAPLGEQAELAKTYTFTDYGSVAGKVYGIASFGAANGFVYNKDVWKQAGVTAWPTTPEQFLDGLRKIKAAGVTPYYTNYKDGWPLSSWSNVVGSVSCDTKANDRLATTEPWAAGTDLTVGDSLLYNIVKEKLAEADPTTTNWEDSKGQIATGKIGTMWLGSWAVSQMQDAAKKAGKDPSVIGYMPFPAQSGGKYCSVVSPDKLYGINVHSKNKPAARAWLDWVLHKSGYAETAQAVSTVKGAPAPAALQAYTEAGVSYVELSQADAVKVTAIDNASEIGLTKADYRQKLIDIARGASKGDLPAYLAELNKKWTAAAKTVG